MQRTHAKLTSFLATLLFGLLAVTPLTLLNNSGTSVADASGSATRYDIGNPTVTDIWVRPGGSADANGSIEKPFPGIAQALAIIPRNQTLTTGYHIHVLAGSYGAETMPNYPENIFGTYTAPVIIEGEGDVQINGNFNIFNVKYFYLIGLKLTSQFDVVHFEKGDHVLLRNMTLRSNNRAAQETFKANQSQHIYIEDSDISGAHDNAIDMVGVQYGHMIGNRIHDANDWCAYVKGGSAYWLIEGNEIFNCGTGGFTAGQGTGSEFMVAPWVQYEAYDVKAYNNIIHDTEGAGLGTAGGYNIFYGYNTLYRVGSRSHVIELEFGSHSCDGNTEGCQATIDAGGWAVTSGEASIGDKNVYIYNNIVYNPAGFESQWQHFTIYGPRTNSSSTSAPSTVYTDTNLQIKGNIIWNGSADKSLGLGESTGCQNSNPTCNEAQILRDNTINVVQPQFTNAGTLDFSLPSTSNILSLPGFSVPSFTWESPNGAPTGTLSNIVSKDYYNNTRTSNVAGAATGTSITVTPTSTPSPTVTASPTPTETPTPTSSPTPTISPTPTSTPTPSATPTSSPTPTITPTPTVTPTPVPTNLADIEGYWNNVDKICRISRRGVQTCTLRSSLHPFNAGEVRSSASAIGVYLSADETLDPSDTLIKTVNMKRIRAGDGIAIRFSYRGAMDYRATPYLIAKFDPNNTIAESDETDNITVYPL
ncbi:MAG: right-handed parallel beta-helix repeat-containing protein [Candidatus Abawacabacteria bacterium]|nr:right-handed parallel beta-helix repeat-containing protein [Candidatus Abawacabacteria bacterium]